MEVSQVSPTFPIPWLIVVRNFGIIIALMLFLCVLYLLATEFIAAQKSKGEVLVFRRGKAPADLKAQDEEAHNTGQSVRTIPTDSSALENELTQNEPRAATFVWDSLSYDVKTKDGMRRLLDDVEGWVEPGKLTALMVCIHHLDSATTAS